MNKNEFKDRLFDLLNESEELPIRDIDCKDASDLMDISLEDGSSFRIKIEEL